jgi:hypothetical protein
MKKSILLNLVFILLALPVFSHVTLDSPTGGETYNAGDTIEISWTEEIPHDQENWDLYYSTDGGENWKAIKEDLEISVRSHQWTAPGIETERARIKIVQDNHSSDYEDESGNFNILSEMSTGIEHMILKGFSVYPNPFVEEVTFSLSLNNEVDVTLEIYNLLGKKVTTLNNSTLSPGKHEIYWNASGMKAGIYFYKLKAGEILKTGKLILENL